MRLNIVFLLTCHLFFLTSDIFAQIERSEFNRSFQEEDYFFNDDLWFSSTLGASLTFLKSPFSSSESAYLNNRSKLSLFIPTEISGGITHNNLFFGMGFSYAFNAADPDLIDDWHPENRYAFKITARKCVDFVRFTDHLYYSFIPGTHLFMHYFEGQYNRNAGGISDNESIPANVLRSYDSYSAGLSFSMPFLLGWHTKEKNYYGFGLNLEPGFTMSEIFIHNSFMFQVTF